MKIQTSSFNKLAGLGEDYGKIIIRLEMTAPITPSPATGLFAVQHTKAMGVLQAFSERVLPWYPILESRFTDLVTAFFANSLSRGPDAFLVLIVLASGAIAQETSPGITPERRPDAEYSNAAMERLHLVIHEQSQRSVQCLAAASIHCLLLLQPIRAHEYAVMGLKKARDLHTLRALAGDDADTEQWLRLYRILLLIEEELVVPLRLAESNAWESEEEVGLPTGADIWSFGRNSELALSPAGTADTAMGDHRSDNTVTYLLAAISMRRMLRRNTAAVTVSSEGTVEYAPLIAQELEIQLEQWWSVLPGSIRFQPEDDNSEDACQQTVFLRAQYWACKVSYYWPAVVQIMDSKHLTEVTAKGSREFFRSYRQFIKSAIRALEACLPNRWTLYAR